MTDKGKPLYMIGVVADMLKLHPQTLRMYEKKGLIRPSRCKTPPARLRPGTALPLASPSIRPPRAS